MSRDPLTLIQTIDQIDPAWLAGVLGTGPIATLETERIGTGQMSQTHRVRLEYTDQAANGPASAVIKVAAADPTSRSTGVSLGIYESEIRFYQEVAPRIGGPLPACHLAAFDEVDGWFTLVLEDVAPAVQGDQIQGCGVDRARLAVRELARLHAPVFGDPDLGATEWLNQPSRVDQTLVSQLLPGFFDRYGERITADHRQLCESFITRLDAWLADSHSASGLVHGDFRLDNLLFGEPDSPRPLTVVDWQTVAWGPAMTDASYFLGGGLVVEERRSHEQELLREYHRALGVDGFSYRECWEGYRRQALSGVLMAIIAPMLVERTERGDDMFMTMLARHAQHALDLDSLKLVPEPASGTRPPPLRPDPGDEARHPAGSEQLWNESWYFDAVTEDASLGAYVRVGLYPNLGQCWYTAFVCGRDRPAVAIVDYAAPLPGESEGLRVKTAVLQADHQCETELERFRVTLEATGQAYADQAAPLTGAAGDPVPVGLDLRWDTDGTPYSYRMTTRYEIACRVSGTIRVGDEVMKLRDAPGQRDHSWGLRDWWAMDWVWMAGRLENGTRLHAVDLRIPDTPRLSVGYVQPPGEDLVELARLDASETVAPDGLITSARLSLTPGDLELSAEPVAFGALLLTAPDGRISHFPRAMCRLTSPDGRRGVAWMEWNRNQPRG